MFQVCSIDSLVMLDQYTGWTVAKEWYTNKLFNDGKVYLFGFFLVLVGAGPYKQ